MSIAQLQGFANFLDIQCNSVSCNQVNINSPLFSTGIITLQGTGQQASQNTFLHQVNGIVSFPLTINVTVAGQSLNGAMTNPLPEEFMPQAPRQCMGYIQNTTQGTRSGLVLINIADDGNVTFNGITTCQNNDVISLNVLVQYAL